MGKIELTVGKKNGTDLAKWFGVAAGTFRAHKDNYLEKLKYYADYEINEQGKIIIKEVYEPYYDTEKTIEKFNALVPLYWKKSESMINTAANVGREIYWDELENHPDGRIAQLQESTAIAYAGKGRLYNYGSPLQGKEGGGVRGYCQYTWAKIGPDGQFERPLTEEEQKIKDNLYQHYFGNVNDKDVFLLDLRERELITDEQLGKLFREYYKNKISFLEFKKILCQTLGFPVDKGTIVYEYDEEGFPEPISSKKTELIDVLD